ncbi:MAG: tryptophan--tRNA ligase [Candidatus Micrarchaeota archaeon]|nr:tryptophan--tRNA ligase [Candidatus Micrarchaeota archaeon]
MNDARQANGKVGDESVRQKGKGELLTMNGIDPWASEQRFDVSKLIEEFGMSSFTPALASRLQGFLLAKRGGMLAHRELDHWLADSEKGKPVAVMSGIKPSSEFHLGSKLTAQELIFYQKNFGAKVFYAIADLEAFADNGITLEQSHETAVSNVADLLALGLDEKNAHIYKQSEERRVMNAAFIYSKRATPAMLNAIYGERNYSLYFSALVQVADILLPQHKDFGGPKRVLVPVGIDQDPHIRFARDIAFKEKLALPCATYHVTMRGLRGETKMSKRDPMSTLSLSDSQEVAKKKLMAAFTGGRATAEEQRKLGGDIEKDVLYELARFHFIDDDALLEEMKQDMVTGRLLSGEYKQKYVPYMLDWLAAHQKRKKECLPRAKRILEKAQKEG